MKIIVLNGSPKGKQSVTMQYIQAMQLSFTDVEFRVIDVALKIKKLQRDKESFTAVIREVAAADAVIWAFPLYFLLVSSQYKKFIELIFENDAQPAFQGKPAVIITTSINFYDYTAHNYLRAICDDLDMKCYGSYSAEMNDLLKSKERKRFKKFGEMFFEAIREKRPAVKANAPLIYNQLKYQPQELPKVDVRSNKVLIIADRMKADSNLGLMVENLQKAFSPPAEIVQLQDIDIKGGCLGCLQCGMDNDCVYDGKDGFREFFTQKVQSADIVFFAGEITDRYLSSTWKCFFDRSFFRGHTPSFLGRQMGFIISGPLKQLANLRQIMEAYVEFQGANLLGFVSDDSANSDEINDGLQMLARNASSCVARDYFNPPTYLKIGGMKIFRDAVWGGLRMVFQADHRYYKKHGYYDFPQSKYKLQLVNMIVTPLTKIPFIRREFIKRIKQEMLTPYKSALRKVK